MVSDPFKIFGYHEQIQSVLAVAFRLAEQIYEHEFDLVKISVNHIVIFYYRPGDGDVFFYKGDWSPILSISVILLRAEEMVLRSLATGCCWSKSLRQRDSISLSF